MIFQGKARIVLIALPALLLAGFLVLAEYGWLQEHDARIRAETQTGQQQRQIDTLRQQQSAAQQALSVKLASIEKQKQQPATAAQLISETRGLMPSLPQPLQVQSAPPNPALPDAPPVQTVIIPEADFKGIRDAQLTCEENTARLATCQTQITEGQQQLKLTEQQRDEWKAAAKGGSIWHRALGAAKWFAIGAGTGAGMYAITHRR